MAASPVDRIAALLDADDLDKRIAAAIVLGELAPKSRKVRKALRGALSSPHPALQRHAVEALAAVGIGQAVDDVVPLLGATDMAVREAAAEALARVGEELVPKLEARLPDAGPEERRAIEGVLARLGGREAFVALLSGLEDAGEEEAAAAAVSMRQRAKSADANQRRSHLSQLRKLLERLDEREPPNPAAMRAALKMIGYLEDPRAKPILLRHARDADRPAAIRQEALIALRFVLTADAPDAELLRTLVEAAGDDDRSVAQAALMTLSGLPLPAKIAGALDPLLSHPDLDRARFVIDMLAHREGTAATRALVDAVRSAEIKRARLAADALAERDGAVSPTLDALAKCDDPDRARLLARVLRPHASELAAAQRKKLREAALERLAGGDSAWQPMVELLREAEPERTVEELRKLYGKLRRRKNAGDRALAALRALCRSEASSHEDRYELASRLLADSPMDTSATARKADEALSLLGQLSSFGYDVAAALRKDRSVDLDALYYVGFHFVERGLPLGEELLEMVVEQGGRKKIAKMAKNKLALGRG